MLAKKAKSQAGLTLLELTITIAISTIVFLSAGIFLVDVQKGWSTMFRRVHGDIVTDAYVARKAFDGVVRKLARSYTIGADGGSVEVDYWSNTPNNDAFFPDRYARFYWADNQLFIERGQKNPRTELQTEVLAKNVSRCVFSGAGTALKMLLLVTKIPSPCIKQVVQLIRFEMLLKKTLM